MEENNTSCSKPDKGCGCVGYAYVPVQILDNLYDVSKSLTEGTVFPELNLTIDEYGKVCKANGGMV